VKRLLFLLLLASCAHHTTHPSPDLVSIQLLDRNGFSETISAHDRLSKYEATDFLTPQPYQKVVRVYGKASVGKTASKISTYHANGQPWQYLEIENGRAHGKFFEWHPNGQLKIEATVIEGTPDVSEMAQLSWFFDQTSSVFDEKGRLQAKIGYAKGLLEGLSLYFHENGALARRIPYLKDQIDGLVELFDDQGTCLETISYSLGEKDGKAEGRWPSSQLKYSETYQKGKLLFATYLTPDGKQIASIESGFGEQALFEDNLLATLITYKEGVIEGAVKNFNAEGHLVCSYEVKEGMKQGQEWHYFHSSQPKLCLEWDHDTIEGTSKTWYENGILESQREMHGNKKHGTSFAWFSEGDLMLMEEYENDLLMKGSYYKKYEKKAVSKIENGSGVATLYDKEGKFLKKITYEKGLPEKES
jgi:antitoxin component YwqK of YwqJK toxin-antitoxin module